MKILLAKPGLDGHDVGVKVLAHALIEAGHQIIYTGLRKSVEEIVERAKKDVPDIIGLSVLSGTHQILCEKMNLEMKRQNVNIPWIVGGNIPFEDVDILKKTGVNCVFPTGTKIQTVVSYINNYHI